MDVLSKGGAKYIFTFIDSLTKGASPYLIVEKSEIFIHLPEYLAIIERQSGLELKILTTNDGEYYEKVVFRLLKSHRFAHR